MFDYFEAMSRIAKPFVWTASLALLAGVAHAAAPETMDQPYKVILTRNVFGLKPVPPPPEPPKPDEGPPPNIKLTGLISLTSPKKAMFVVTPVGKAAPIYLTVNEGEHSDGDLIEVLEIDEQNGTVKIAMNGVTSTLDFVNNGIKSPVALAAPTGPAGQPSILGMAPPGGQGGLGGGGAPIQFKEKPATPATLGTAPASPTSPIPTRSLRVPPTQPQSQLGPAVPDKPLSVEESVILKKVDELVNQDKINKKQYPPALPIPELDQ